MSREVHLAAYPAGELRPDHFRVVDVETPAPGDGEVLVRNTWTSVDPGMRLRLAESAPAGYFAAFPLDAPLGGILTVGEIIDSRAEGFARGDLVWHAAGWREHSVVRAVFEGLERAPEALVRLLAGETAGKTLVRIA